MLNVPIMQIVGHGTSWLDVLTLTSLCSLDSAACVYQHYRISTVKSPPSATGCRYSIMLAGTHQIRPCRGKGFTPAAPAAAGPG